MRPVLALIMDGLCSMFCKVFGLNAASRWSARVAERIAEVNCQVDDEHRSRFIASSSLTLWRARTSLTKEPETVQWIRSFSSDDVLYDVGANIGTYSILAAHRCRRVYAFEPEAQNFALLNRNIVLNGMHAKIMAFPLAIADTRKFDTLRLSNFSAGAALHSFATNVDFKGQEFVPVFRQGSMSISLDELVYEHGFEFPTRIKVDVDGLEPEIIKGGLTVLHDERLRGILIEVNESDAKCRSIIETLGKCGLGISARGDGVVVSGGKITMRNYIFMRDV